MAARRLFRTLPILIASILLLAAGSFLALEIVSSLNPQSARIAGTVAYAVGSPQRMADTVWEGIGKRIEVYGRDAIRTDGRSRLSIGLLEGAEIILVEDSEIRLSWSRFGREIGLEGGSIFVRRSGAKGKLIVRSKGASIEILDAFLEIRAGAGGTEASVDKGEALLIGKGKEKYLIKEGEEIAADGEGKIGKSGLRALSLDSPKAGNFYSVFGSTAKIDFAWKIQDPAYSSWLLEVSPNRNFASGTIRRPALAPGTSLDLGAGIWHARLSAFKSDGSLLVSRPISFILAADRQPLALEPLDGDVFSFKARPPLVEFSWEESGTASGYLLELSSDPSFSSIAETAATRDNRAAVDSLGEGTWWWRARPLHGFTASKAEEGTKPIRFSIERRETLPPPLPIFPAEGEIVPAPSMNLEGLGFSWECAPETKSSTLIIYKEGETKKPVWRGRSKTGFLLLKEVLSPGNYNWKISSISFDGKKIADSSTRSFRVSEFPAGILLLSPRDGAEIDSGAERPELFSWSSETKTLRLLEISARPDMIEPVLSQETRLLGARGLSLPPGQYYWRVSSLAGREDGSAGARTGTSRVSRFVVLPRLSSPCLISPAGNSVLSLVDEEFLLFSWTGAEGAEFYSFRLSDAKGKTIEELDSVSGTSYSFRALALLKEGSYEWEISAHDSRAGGRKGDTMKSAFRVASLIYLGKPILTAPAWDEELAEMRVYSDGMAFEWKSDPGSAYDILQVGKDPAFTETVLEQRLRGGRDKVSALLPGRYFWRIRSTGRNGAKSASELGSFTVLPAPPLDAPIVLSPSAGERIDMGTRNELSFKWVDSGEANLYLIALGVKEGETIFKKEVAGLAEFSFTELEKLDIGDFEFSIQSKLVGGKERVLRKSETIRLAFSLALDTEIGNPELIGSGILYTK